MKATGTVYVEAKEVVFSSLPSLGMRTAGRFTSIPLELMGPSETPVLDGLAAIRNVLVHGAGIIDADYVEKTKYVPILPKIARDQRIGLTGELVHHSWAGVRDVEGDSVRAVDGWIAGSRRGRHVDATTTLPTLEGPCWSAPAGAGSPPTRIGGVPSATGPDGAHGIGEQVLALIRHNFRPMLGLRKG